MLAIVINVGGLLCVLNLLNIYCRCTDAGAICHTTAGLDYQQNIAGNMACFIAITTGPGTDSTSPDIKLLNQSGPVYRGSFYF